MIDRKVTRLATPLRSQVVDQIRTAIIEGNFLPGSRLKERELIEMLNVSRTVIRESLRQLESENLIVIEPQKGPTVKELTVVEIKEIYQVRRALEVLAIQLFISNRGKKAAPLVKKAHENLSIAFSGENPRKLYKSKNIFFNIIFENCGNHVLKEILNSLSSQLWRLRIMGLSHPNRNPARKERSKKNLTLLYDAIQNRDIKLAVVTTEIEIDDARDEAVRLVSV